MARRSEHNIKRVIFRHLRTKTIRQDSKPFILWGENNLGSIGDSIVFMKTMNSSVVEDLPEFVEYKKRLNALTKEIQNFSKHFEIVYKVEAFQQKFLHTRDSEKLQKKIMLLENDFENYFSAFRSNTLLNNLTAKNFFHFISQSFQIKFTTERELSQIFGENLERLSGMTSIKDLLYDRNSDTVLQFLIAIVIIIEASNPVFPFPIFEKKIYDKAFEGIVFQDSEREKLERVISNLKLLSLKKLPITKEAGSVFVFFNSVNAEFENLSKKCNAVETLLKSLGFILMKSYQKPIEELCEHPEDLAAFIPYGIFSRGVLVEHRKKLKNDLKELEEYKEILLQKYITVVSDVIFEIESGDFASEERAYDNALDEECDKIMLSVAEEDKSRLLTVLKKYNDEAVDDKVMLILYNLTLIDSLRREYLIQALLMQKKCVSKITVPDYSKNELKELLNQRYIKDDYIILLTNFKFRELSELEWNFMMLLPELYKSNQYLMSNFLYLLWGFNGDKAYRNLNEIL